MPGWLPRLARSATGRFGVIVVAVVALTALVSLFWTCLLYTSDAADE